MHQNNFKVRVMWKTAATLTWGSTVHCLAKLFLQHNLAHSLSSYNHKLFSNDVGFYVIDQCKEEPNCKVKGRFYLILIFYK